MYECMEPKQYACLEGSELSPIYVLDRVPEPGGEEHSMRCSSGGRSTKFKEIARGTVLKRGRVGVGCGQIFRGVNKI